MIRQVSTSFSARALTAAFLAWNMIAVPALSRAQGSHTTDTSVEDFDLVIPSCSGEDVHVFGPIDTTVQTTVNANGSTVVMHFTPHLTAIGLTSGLAYVAVGPGQITTHTGAAGGTTTFVNVTKLIAPGSAPDLNLIEVGHVTVNANGVTTVSFDNLKGGC